MTIDLGYQPGGQELFADTNVSSQPYPHFVVSQLFSPELCSAILGFFEQSVRWNTRHIDDFYDIYQVDMARLDLPPELRFLTEPAFFDDLRRGFESRFGCRLAAQVTFTAHKMVPGYKIKVHNDAGMGQCHRLVVQLNRGWSEESGGILMLLDSHSPEAPSDQQQFLLPVSGSAVGFEISQRSYHAVSPVISGERYTFSISFSPDPEAAGDGQGQESVLLAARANMGERPGKARNELSKLGRFLHAWDNRSALLNLMLVDVTPSSQGNIGEPGEQAGRDGHSLTRWHPQFESILEPKVRPLVRLLVDCFEWITYSSCEGHRFSAGSFVERDVGMLPRTEEERRTMLAILGRACFETLAQHPGSAAVPRASVSKLRGEDEERTTVDLVFNCAGNRSEEDYFQSLDEVTGTLVHRLVLLYQEREFGLLEL